MSHIEALAAAAVLAVGLAACGGSGGSSHTSVSDSSSAAKTAGTERTSTSLYRQADADKDNDVGAPHDDTSNARKPAFGRAATSSQRRAATALIKSYYAAARAGDGARGCALLYSTLAQSLVEDNAQPPGPAYMRGAKSCAEVLDRLFARFHRQLAMEAPKLEVVSLRMQGRQGIALLRFGALPERETWVAQEKHTWKMNAIYDQELP